MNYISDILYWISTGLLVPVIVLLIFFFCRALLLAGSFFGQYLDIRRNSFIVRKELDALDSHNVNSLAERLPKKSTSLAISYMNLLLAADGAAREDACFPIMRSRRTRTCPFPGRLEKWARCSDSWGR